MTRRSWCTVAVRLTRGYRISPFRQLILLFFVVSGSVTSFAQSLPASSTTITATPSPLILPGTLQLTSVVNQTPASGAVPTGTISFYSDSTNILGTSPLKIIPSTQAFTGGLTLTAASTNAAGLATLTLTAGGRPVTVSVDSTSGVIALYQLNAGYTAVTTSTYSVFYSDSDSPEPMDAVAAGYFLQPKSSGIQSFLVHAPYEYLVFDGSAAQETLNPPTQTSPSGCFCSNPDQESISIDDFDGDGYSDIGVLIPQNVESGVAGVVLNTGVSDPGYFASVDGGSGLIAAPTPSDVTEIFCPIAVTTGHFTSAAVAQLAVLGRTPASGDCFSVAPTDPSTIYLYQLDAARTGLVQVGTPLVLTDTNASILASSDLNQDGFSDLIIGESIPSGETYTGGVRTALNNGDGSFKAPSALTSFGSPPGAITVNDFNGDGFPDFALTFNDAYVVYLTDGSGNIANSEVYLFNPAITATPGGIASGDFHGDGLADLVVIPGSAAAAYPDFSYEFNSAAAQATLSVTPSASTLPPGSHNLTASYSGDGNFAVSTSTPFPLAVTQTTPAITWAAPASLEYGVPLSAAQLNATASVAGTFSYAPAAGAILAPGSNTVTATFAPTDSYDYSAATATQTITVTPPGFTSIAPSSVNLGAAATKITITGQGLLNGATVEMNGTPLPTTWVSLGELTAVIPQSSSPNPGTGTAASYTITVVDPNKVAVTGSQTFTVLAAPVTAQASVAATVDADQQSSITLTVNPYPVAITATLTLSFTPAPPATVVDKTVAFTNGTTTDVVSIPANSSAAIPPIAFAAGTTAGTITLTVQLTAGGTNVTPASLVPIDIAIPAGPPEITSATLTPNGDQMTIVINGFSSTRDLASAQFHFTAASGQTLKTSDLTVSLGTPADSYYSSSESDNVGTEFVYTQPFTLSTNASDIASVTITLTNSQGTSQPTTVQPGTNQ